jgi:electron transfer flavoprotein alpha subunit
VVIAINSDPDAPIFDYADYCIVGDVHQVVPALIQELQRVGEVSCA